MALRSMLAVAVAAGMAAACSSGSMTTATNTNNGGGTTGGNVNAAAVNVQDYAFSPATLTVKVGAALTFTNYGAAAHHPVADNGSWDAGQLAPAQSGAYGIGTGMGGAATVSLADTGSFTFHCTIHPTMTGTITVTP